MDREKLNKQVDALRKAMETMTNEERLELLSRFMEGYCRECGTKEQGHRCHCWNDE